MKLSIFLDHLLQIAEKSGRPLTEVFEQAQALGIEAAECCLADLDSEAVRAAFRQTGMAVSGIYTSFDFRLNDNRADIEHLLTRAQEMKAPGVMPLPGLLREGEELTVVRQIMADGIALVCEMAKPHGIQVVLEDFGFFEAPFGTIEGLSWFLEQVPALGCCFDSGNFRIHAQDAVIAYEQLKERVCHAHLKDWADQPTFGTGALSTADGVICYPAPIGNRMVNNEVVLKGLQRDGYQGYCAIEIFDLDDLMGGLRQSVEWIRGVLAQEAL